MNYRLLIIFLAIFNMGSVGYAQLTHLDDSKAFQLSLTTQQGKDFPQVNSEGRVKVSIAAPNANKVQLDLGGKKYDLVKDSKGIWTGMSDPQDEGFHY